MPRGGNSTHWPRRMRGWGFSDYCRSSTDTHRIRSSAKYPPHMPGSKRCCCCSSYSSVRLMYTHTARNNVFTPVLAECAAIAVNLRE